MKISKFQRGSSTYTCQSCKRRTRNTGDEGQNELCKECWELAGIDNHVNDTGRDDDGGSKDRDAAFATYRDEVMDYVKSLAKHGVDATTLGFDFLTSYIKAELEPKKPEPKPLNIVATIGDVNVVDTVGSFLLYRNGTAFSEPFSYDPAVEKGQHCRDEAFIYAVRQLIRFATY